MPVELFGWEDIPPDAGRPQGLINAAVAKFDPNWFVFIFWHRFGSDAGDGMTGTEEEWKIALQLKQQRGDALSVSAYFNRATAEPYEVDDQQLKTLNAFKENTFKHFSALTIDFNGAKDFEDKFRAHLTDKLINLSPIIPKGLPYIPEHLLNASTGLLSWPATLRSGQYIERNELQTILQRIDESESSTTIILGSPGTGKSALLATLANRLRQKGTPLLAIKADQLGSAVNSPEDLRDFLGLPIIARDAIKVQSEKEKIVLIIDQLDAVSELLDRKSGRLNVLLNLVHSLARQPNIHIVASSREFEFRHDIRLASIDAERLNLAPPNWDQVAAVISQSGINPTTMGESLKELLLVPLNLKVFLDISTPNLTFESFHALLEELWRQRVVEGQNGNARERLLELLAQRMGDEETLWLPSAVSDSDPVARKELEQADILAHGSNGLTIGFRHQTFYDFTLARMFARGSRSLVSHVLERQNGLFVRPYLISVLNYLRSTSRSEYHRQLRSLMESNLRLHLRMLIIEFLGGQVEPDDREAQLLTPLLASDNEGPRILRSVANSWGWFARLRRLPALRNWLSASPEMAAHCVPLFSFAMHHYPNECMDLIEEFWIGNEAYDALSLAVLLERKDWDHHGANLAASIARRIQFSWRIDLLAETVAESAPSEAPVIVRADFDRRLEKALLELKKPLPTLLPDADEQQKLRHRLEYERAGPIRRVIEDSQSWHNLEEFAVRAPHSFLDQLWPWFLAVVNQMADDEHDSILSYRRDPTSYRSFEGDLEPVAIVRALLSAIVAIATQDKTSFLKFLRENESSDMLIVHRLLARGLESIASQESQTILQYLCGDHRRLVLGDMHDSYIDTKRLIGAVCPHLARESIQMLEAVILAYPRYKRVPKEWSRKERFQKKKWERENRLDLLRAFPLDVLTPETKKLRLEEERVFPALSQPHDSHDEAIFGEIGAPMRAADMERASDENLLHLFDELPDYTGWDHPKRLWLGGAVQLSREFGEFAKNSPTRSLGLISRLKPTVHEQYAGEALQGLAKADLPVKNVISLIEELDDRGFQSWQFRQDAATVAEALAARDKGLLDSFLRRLETWLNEIAEPAWPEPQSEDSESNSYERTTCILYGHGITSSLTHGRGSIIRAIAQGYLKRDPPALDGWAEVIRSRLIHEKHPKIWSETLTRMPVLFQSDRRRATELFDGVIHACPEVLRYPFALISIARALRGADPKEKAEGWLDNLLADGSPICQQAYGEILPLFNCWRQDVSSKTRLTAQLSTDANPDINRGMAYAAARLWSSKVCREMVTQILVRLASSTDDSVQRAVASIFRLARDCFEVDDSMRAIIESVCSNHSVLALAAEDLVEAIEGFTGAEPEVVSQVCREVLNVGPEQMGKPGVSWISAADTLTNIALTLHRQDAYREIGLELFEKLIALNIREAQAAIETLDRRPIVTISHRPRRRWRRRSKGK